MTEALVTVEQKTKFSFASFLRQWLDEFIPDREVVATKTIDAEGVPPASATDASKIRIDLQGYYPIDVFINHDPEKQNGDVTIEARLGAKGRSFDEGPLSVEDGEKVTFPFNDVAETRITIDHNPKNHIRTMVDPSFYNFSRIKFVDNLRKRQK